MIERLGQGYDKDDVRERARLHDILASLEQDQQESGKSDGKNVLVSAQENYAAYKIKYKKNFRFDPTALSFGNYTTGHFYNYNH